MSEQLLGEIRACAFDFAPKGWALCNGQLLLIQPNQSLFALLGTTYGGNGQTTFGLPDLRGRVVMGMSTSHVIGQVGGAENYLLTPTELPAHSHSIMASD